MGLVTAAETGGFEFARSFTFGIGGAESNVAIGAARLGSPVTWFGRVGQDAAGDLVERRLSAENITTLAIRDPGYTGLMVKHRRFGDRVQVDYHRWCSAGSRICPEDVPTDVVAAAGILHVTGITPALSDTARDAVFHAVEVARTAGVTVSVDVNYRSKLWEAATASGVLRDLVRRADIVFAGPQEARLFVDVAQGDDNARLAAALADLGPSEVVIKDGARGCCALVEGEALHQAAVAVSVVDPVGAGDAFAGYLADHLAGRPPAERLLTAVATGALAVTVPGDCENLPRRDDLAALVSAEDVAR